ncbi:MAG: hypothetical protein ACXW4A_00160 [Nitrospira sp.]
MDKWLAKFLDETPEYRTDKPDILPEGVRVSGLSGPFPCILPESSCVQADDVLPTLPFRPGQWVEWLSPALPTQQGEVVALDADHFEVYHPLTETLCRLPISWVTRVMKLPTNREGHTP